MRDLYNLLAVALLAAAAWRDVAVRIIPDPVCVGLLVLGLSVRGLLGPTCLMTSLAAALALFLLLVPLHAHRLLGGGDVKLAAAFAAGLAPCDTYRFVVVTALAGGVLALGYLALARLPRPRIPRARSALVRVLAVERQRIRRRGPLPYGVAIAVGAVFVLLA